jgi:catechol-2,3-dioxygenase
VRLEAHISHLGVRTPDPGRLASFYQDVVGLSPHPATAASSRLGWASGHHVLELVEGPAGFDHFGLEVRDAETLDRLASRLASARVPAAAEHPPGEHPPVLACADPDGNRIELHGRIDRSGEETTGTGRRPVRLHHLTFGSGSLPEMAEFYCDVLGFQVSDTMEGEFTWLRCNPEHHTVAVVEAARGRLDHFAYELAGWADFKTWCDDLADLDVPIAWGPGRHGPGNNLFVMFDDPDGTHVELSAEMERFEPGSERQPREWPKHPRTTNLWGPPAPWR